MFFFRGKKDSSVKSVKGHKLRFGIVWKMTLMVVAVLGLQALSQAYLAKSIQKMNVDIEKSTATIKSASGMIQDQATILTRLEIANEAVRTFRQLRYWITDLALSMLNDSETAAETELARLDSFLTELADEKPQVMEKIQSDVASFYETALGAVDAYADENRVLGNSLSADGRRLAERIEAELSNCLREISIKAAGVGQTVVESNEAILQSNNAIVEKNSTLVRVAVILPIVVTLIGLAVAFLFSRRIASAIKTVVSRAQAIAGGDLTGEQLPVRSRDEIGHLTIAINEMSVSLRDVVTEVATSASNIGIAVTRIAASSQEMSDGMGDQSQQVEKVASSIEQMSESVGEVARKSSKASRSAIESGQVAEDGGIVVDQTIDGMRGINEAVIAGANSVTELGKRGEQIGKIIDVINDIADQTNLLALNAAIEAARAGEHGRGFAVVADEVRKLADRTTKATDEIAESITLIQTETSEAVHRMNAGTDQVSIGMESATKAGQSLSKIVNSAQEVAGMIQSIAAAAEEQSSASEEIRRNIEAIGSITEKANEGARESAEALNGLSQQSAQLQTMLGRFKLASDMQGESAKWFRKADVSPKILVVDDDPSILRLIENYLNGIGELTLVDGGQQAVSSFRNLLDQEQRFDLICLDISMPDLDGRDVLKQIRELEVRYGIQSRQRCRVVMISALDTPQDKLKSFREACDAYLTKPIDKDKLLQVLGSFDLKAA